MDRVRTCKWGGWWAISSVDSRERVLLCTDVNECQLVRPKEAISESKENPQMKGFFYIDHKVANLMDRHGNIIQLSALTGNSRQD